MRSRFLFAALVLYLTISAMPVWAGALIINEFRVRGPGGASDEFIEIYNNSGADHTVAASSGTGYGVAASDGITRCSLPNGTVLPKNGSYLCVNSIGYSLAGYPAGNGTTATGDATYTTNIGDNAGIALFNNNSGGASYSLANRLDAVGSTSEANTLYKEGIGYAALTPFSIDYAWIRDTCGKGGAVNLLTPCTLNGNPKDTDSNAADFYFVDTNGTSAGGGQRLGTPGPQNLSSPVAGTSSISNTQLDTCVGSLSAAPNFVRDFTSNPANNSTFGTIDIRRTFTNNTGGNLTRLRFRIIDLDTFPAAAGFADLRPRTSTDLVVTVDRPPCGSGTSNVLVKGTTLEQPPSQPNGGGFNSTLGAGSITLGTPLANGGSVDLRFLFGIQQTGNFRVAFVIEGLPKGGSTSETLFLECSTDGACVAPIVSSILRADPNPTELAAVNYNVTFNQSVTGVDITDFALTTTGTISGSSVTSVSGSGANYTVTINTGIGAGTIRLDVIDNDSIVNGTFLPLGDTGANNGNFITGEAYTINHACGDGILQASVEVCDDGNADNTDSCLDTCLSATCGDGFIHAGVEACDDSNTTSDDGCSDVCQIDVDLSDCGNGTINAGEVCDDSNTTNGDGCSNTCQIEAVCGNGTLEAGETCDDSNTTNSDGCSATCAIETENGLECANPGIVFSNLTEGIDISLSASALSCGGFDLTSSCTCAWSLNPAAQGNFNNASTCNPTFTPASPGTGQMTADVDCGGGSTGTFNQTIVVNPTPDPSGSSLPGASGGGCSLRT